MAGNEESDFHLVYAITPETPFTPTSIAINPQHNYRLGNILRKTESRHVEFKTGGGNYIRDIFPEHIRKYGSAFLNSGGGQLCVGVTDKGEISGVRIPVYEKENIRKIIHDEFMKFTPPVKGSLYEVDFVKCNKVDYYVLEVSVRPGDPYEIYSDGENKMYYKREGSIEGPLWPGRIKEIVISKYEQKLEAEKKNKS